MALKPEMVDTVMQFLEEFNSRKELSPHEMEWLMMETDAMKDVVLNLDKLDYIAGAIVIDGKVEAFSIGAKTGRETVTKDPVSTSKLFPESFSVSSRTFSPEIHPVRQWNMHRNAKIIFICEKFFFISEKDSL